MPARTGRMLQRDEAHGRKLLCTVRHRNQSIRTAVIRPEESRRKFLPAATEQPAETEAVPLPLHREIQSCNPNYTDETRQFLSGI